MTIYRPKKSPYYHYEFQFRGVRYYGSTGCTAKRDAERFERDRRSEVALGKKDKPSITLDEATGLYWQDKGQFEKAHVTTETQLANLNRLLGACRVFHELDDLDLSAMVAHRRGEKARNKATLVSNATVNREVELLKRVRNHVEPRYRVPTFDWKRHRLPEPKERVRWASPEEERRLLDAALAEDVDLADVIEFAILSGARRNAVVTLLWSKVDLARRWAEVRTKGDVWHGFPISDRMLEIIANRPKVGPYVFTYQCRQTRKAHTDKKGRKHRARVKGERYPFSREGWNRRWYGILKTAGIENFRFHDLRHTAGTRITKSSNIKVAQKLLGHSRIETTARYAHIEADDIRAAMEAVEQSRNSPEPHQVSGSEKRQKG